MTPATAPLATADAELRSALDGFPAGRNALADHGARASPIAAGAENRVWRVVSVAGDWVVRLGGGRDARLLVDRRRELACVALAGAAGFAPAVVHASADSGLLVGEHVHGRAWSRADACSASGIERFGARLRALHMLPVPADLAPVDPRAVVESYLGHDARTDAPIARAMLRSLAERSLDRLAPDPRALCHHDLHHRNVIDCGALVFVDWEYAGRGEPLFDLAAFAAYHDFDGARRSALLAAYTAAGPPVDGSLGDAARIDRARFDAACVLFDCVQALWYDVADAWNTLAAHARDALAARLRAAAS